MRRISVLVALAAVVAFGQAWEGPYRLTTSPGDDVNPCACPEWVTADVTCLVWQTNRAGNWDVYSSFCSYNEGNTWGPERVVASSAADEVDPCVAWVQNPTGDAVFWCVWERVDSSGFGRVLAAHSVGDSAWSAPEVVGRTVHQPSEAAEPTAVVTGGMSRPDTIWVAWLNHDTPGSSVLCAHCGGDTWLPAETVAVSAGRLRHARIGRGQHPQQSWVDCPLVVWEDSGDIRYSLRAAGGWTAPASVAPSPAWDANPEVVSKGGMLNDGPWVTWETNRDGDTAIYGTARDTMSVGRRWCDTVGAGNNHTPAGTPVEFTTKDQWLPRVAVWVSDRRGNPDVYSTNPYGLGGDLRVDLDPAADLHPTLTTYYWTILWCCWQSNRDGNWEIYASYVAGVGVSEPRGAAAVSQVRAWPNPCTGILRLDDVPATAGRAALLDVSGRRVMALRPGANDVGRLAPGVYFVRTAATGQARRVVLAR